MLRAQFEMLEWFIWMVTICNEMKVSKSGKFQSWTRVID